MISIRMVVRALMYSSRLMGAWGTSVRQPIQPTTASVSSSATMSTAGLNSRSISCLPLLVIIVIVIIIIAIGKASIMIMIMITSDHGSSPLRYGAEPRVRAVARRLTVPGGDAERIAVRLHRAVRDERVGPIVDRPSRGNDRFRRECFRPVPLRVAVGEDVVATAVVADIAVGGQLGVDLVAIIRKPRALLVDHVA